jgi:hypothetical protein
MRSLMQVLPIVVLAGCAAVLGSKQKDFSLSSTPAGADVYLDGNRLGTTPVRVKLSNQASHTFVFRREGYREASCTLSRGTGGGWVILDVLTGLVPVIIDAATNSWSQTKGDGCTQSLEPINAGATPVPTTASTDRTPYPATRTEPSTPKAGLVDDVPPGTNWVADAKARVYYRAGCPATARISPGDRLYYANESPLQSAGYKKSDEC